MTPFILYLIKVNFALVVLYTFYKLMFTKDTFFGLRRFMLILIYITSFVYPLFSIPGWMTMNHTGQVINDFYETVLPELEITYTAGVGKRIPGRNLYWSRKVYPLQEMRASRGESMPLSAVEALFYYRIWI